MKKRFITEARPFWDDGHSLKAGEILYEHIKNQHRPRLASEILEICKQLISPVPEIDEVYAIAND